MGKIEMSLLQKVCEATDRAADSNGEQLVSWDEVERAIAENDRWHAELEASLAWQPIATYVIPADPMGEGRHGMFRDGVDSMFGAWVAGAWTQITGGADYPVDDFEPTEWAMLPPNVAYDFATL
jgi:hypothetical protein